jgi:transposase
MLYKWRKDFDKFGTVSFPGKGTLKQTPEQKIISNLEVKLKEAELERDILKKAVGIFPRAVDDI